MPTILINEDATELTIELKKYEIIDKGVYNDNWASVRLAIKNNYMHFDETAEFLECDEVDLLINFLQKYVDKKLTEDCEECYIEPEISLKYEHEYDSLELIIEFSSNGSYCGERWSTDISYEALVLLKGLKSEREYFMNTKSNDNSVCIETISGTIIDQSEIDKSKTIDTKFIKQYRYAKIKLNFYNGCKSCWYLASDKDNVGDQVIVMYIDTFKQGEIEDVLLCDDSNTPYPLSKTFKISVNLSSTADISAVEIAHSLHTPLGKMKLYIDNDPINYSTIQICEKNTGYPDDEDLKGVDGLYLVAVDTSNLIKDTLIRIEFDKEVKKYWGSSDENVVTDFYINGNSSVAFTKECSESIDMIDDFYFVDKLLIKLSNKTNMIFFTVAWVNQLKKEGNNGTITEAEFDYLMSFKPYFPNEFLISAYNENLKFPMYQYSDKIYHCALASYYKNGKLYTFLVEKNYEDVDGIWYIKGEEKKVYVDSFIDVLEKKLPVKLQKMKYILKEEK